MKRTILVIILISVIVPITLQAQSGRTVSFKSYGPINGTSVGLKLGPLAVYGGLGIIRLTAEFERSYTNFSREWYCDDNTGECKTSPLYKSSEGSSSFEGQALLAIPHAGAKLYLVQSSLNAYLLGSASLVIPSVSGRTKGTRTHFYYPEGSETETWEEELEESDREQIHDALDFIGITVGFGVEYPVNEYFTVGGEYGLTIFSNSAHFEGENESNLGYWNNKWEEKIKASLGITNTCITLNYYF